MNDGDYVWHTFTDPGPKSGARKFSFERVSFVNGVECHREVRTVWTYSRGALDSLIARWRRIGTRPSLVEGRTYTYAIKE